MSLTGDQELDQAPVSPGDLQMQLSDWEHQLRIRSRIHVASALVFLIGMGTALWLFFEVPAKSEEAIGGAIGFALIGIFNGIQALSTRRQTRAMRSCRETLEKRAEQPDRT
jgi:hypothetical protein